MLPATKKAVPTAPKAELLQLKLFKWDLEISAAFSIFACNNLIRYTHLLHLRKHKLPSCYKLTLSKFSMLSDGLYASCCFAKFGVFVKF